MIEMGLAVSVGLLVIFWKLSWKWKLWMLSHPVFMDCAIFALLCFLHWGTFSGVMVATFGALGCSLMLSLGRWLYGDKLKGKYVPGKIILKGNLS